MIGIYQITCIPTGKIYIGSSIYLSQRWSHHKSDLKRGAHSNRYLQNSWNKYGEDQFTFEVLEYLDDATKINEIEEKWIALKNATDKEIGFNMLAKCGKGQLGLKKSPEAVEKQRQRMLGTKQSKETIEKRMAGVRGRKRPSWIVEKTWAGRRASGKVRPPQEMIDRLSKPIVACNKQGEVVHRFPSLNEAGRAGYSSLNKAMKNGNLVKGLIWCYEAELDKLDVSKFSAKKKGKTQMTPYLDTETGIYYESQKELALSMGIHPSSLYDRLKKDEYRNRYIKV